MGKKILICSSVLLILMVPGFFLFRSLYQTSKPYCILCIGDSLTAGSYGSYLPNLKSYFKGEGVNIQVVSGAKPGFTSGEYLAYLRSQDVLKETAPDAVVVLLGTNDVRIDGDHTPLPQFIKNIRSILKMIMSYRNRYDSMPAIFLATIPPIFNIDLPTFSERSTERITREIVPALRKLAQESRVQVIDLYARLKNKPSLLPGIHPNSQGYQYIAKTIFKKLVPFIKGMPPEKEEKLPARFKGKIAFQSDRSGNEDIFIISHTGIKQVTFSQAFDGYPAFSPDGRSLVFESNRSGRFEIYRSDLKGGVHRLFSSSSNDRYPFWTQDGEFIFFSREQKKREQIFRYSIKDRQIKQMTAGKGRNSVPALSPSGRFLLVTSNKLIGWNVYKIDLSTGEENKLSTGYGGCRARYSYDGLTIAWVSHKVDHKGDIFLTPATRFKPHRLTVDSQKHDYFPAFSPDNRYLVYASGPKLKSGNYDIKIIEISTKKIWTITNSLAKDVVPFWARN